jgi:hypothetical protein
MSLVMQFMEILIEKNKTLLKLIQFLSKPYSTPDITNDVRKYKFNNVKPFKMVI